MDDESLEDWLLDKLIPNPDPGGFLGITTDTAYSASTLSIEDFNFFTCHSVRRHVLYCETDEEGVKHYECLECPGLRDQGDA